eukprot:TRINITY_DN64097_c0_g1_i1.p1 TRINITY_DN64097_c0_g1~~TRINITY_DN64097_c0_g1_i1.p1  ORF type:complete len:383 (+),score=52.17 TRINITY_DN64097_c0_g1_i1:95-1243(+)
MADTEEPSWFGRACEVLESEPELGYRTLHSRLQQEGLTPSLKKIQKFATTWRTTQNEKTKATIATGIAPAGGCSDTPVLSASKPYEKSRDWRATLGCFELAPVEGKGIGAFATCDLECGDLVVEEIPVLEYDHENALMIGHGGDSVPGFIRTQWNQLSQEQHAKVMELHDCHGVEKTLLGILKTNALARGCESTGSVLCTTISRFNHSCSPNCQHSWDEDAKVERLMACTSIKAGEELCTYYVEIRQPTIQRRRELQVRYGFACTCESCSSTSSRSDRRRAKILELDSSIFEVGARDQKRALGMVQDLLDKYDEEGIYNQSLRARACYDGFQLALPLRDLRAAQKWIEKSYMHYVLGEGPENPSTQKMLAYVRDPRSHRNWR